MVETLGTVAMEAKTIKWVSGQVLIIPNLESVTRW